MEEKNLDFDKRIDRRSTDCLKYDFALQRGKPDDVLPLWVADMDFMTSSLVLDELTRRVRHGVFGYTETDSEYFDSVAGWMKSRHNWDVKPQWLVKTPGVVFALAMAVKAFTKSGDAVLISQPVYYPFTEVIEDNERQVVSSDLVLGSDGKYRIDFDDFERKAAREDVKLFLLCSPHNPVGRVWTKEELKNIGDICKRHGVLVVSDEIHEDFVYGSSRHTVFAGICSEFQNMSVTCTSPAKTFNLAGLQISNIFIANEELREKFKKQVAAAGYSQANTMGIAACMAAYNYGSVWYENMLSYVEENIDFMKKYIDKEMGCLSMTKPEGTYLVWVDFRKLGLRGKKLSDFIVNEAKLWLDDGAVFGKTGDGFERFNVACSRSTLKQALDQLKNAITKNYNQS